MLERDYEARVEWTMALPAGSTLRDEVSGPRPVFVVARSWSLPGAFVTEGVSQCRRVLYPSQSKPLRRHCWQAGPASSHLILRSRHVQQPVNVLVRFARCARWGGM